MSESKTYVFGNEAAGGNLLASVLPALQNRGIDSSYLLDDIIGKIHKTTAPLICECCRSKHKHDGRK